MEFVVAIHGIKVKNVFYYYFLKSILKKNSILPSLLWINDIKSEELS
jgi:hypothetical protein